jgi:hypothetical protein
LSVIPPDISAAEFAKNPAQVLSVIQHGTGIEEYEASHGLATRPFEEVRQEMGLRVLRAEPIGFVKESPSLGGVAHELFAVLVGHQPSGDEPEPNEQIRLVEFFSPEEVKNVKTICGLTQAALWRFRSWALTESTDPIWREVASKL